MNRVGEDSRTGLLGERAGAERLKVKCALLRWTASVPAGLLCLVVIMVGVKVGWAQPELEWIHSYGTDRADICSDHIQTPDGGFLLVGTSMGLHIGSAPILVVKTDANGDSLWARGYHPYYAHYQPKVVETSDGGFLIAASVLVTGNDNPPDASIMLLKINSSGDTVWARDYGIFHDISIGNLISLPNGEFAIGGGESLPHSTSDIYLLRVNSQGDSLWMKTYGSAYCEDAYDVIYTSRHQFALSGTISSEVYSSPSFLLVFADENGDSICSYRVSFGESTAGCSTIQELPGDSFVLSGSCQFPEPNIDEAAITVALDH